MIAFCARCNDAQECDERGCTVCAAVRLKTALRARIIRARKRARNVCINGWSHGYAVPGKTKCERCLVVHRASNRGVA